LGLEQVFRHLAESAMAALRGGDPMGEGLDLGPSVVGTPRRATATKPVMMRVPDRKSEV
jgi:hypothetical protein